MDTTLPPPASPSNSINSSSSSEPAPHDAANSSRGDTPFEPIEDSITCSWGTCGQVFTHLPTLISHIHDTHIGAHKSSYTCEWSSCSRRGLPQTSRFALVSHLRAHTGERPFECKLPQCDKAFARQDALAKHMRLQHNMTLPPATRGSRKRKREDDEGTEGSNTKLKLDLSGVASTNGGGGDDNNDAMVDDDDSPVPSLPLRESPTPPTHNNNATATDNADTPNGEGATEPDTPDALPAHLLDAVDPSTGLIHGRSQSMVLYLLMKAKHAYTLEQHGALSEELKVVRTQLKKECEEKERALDDLLHGVFGAEADAFIAPIPPPPPRRGHANGTAPPPPQQPQQPQPQDAQPPNDGRAETRVPPPEQAQNMFVGENDPDALARIDRALDSLVGPMQPPPARTRHNGHHEVTVNGHGER